jgi:hypothetical protein
MPKMPLPQYPDKVKYLDEVKPKLLAASEPKEFRSQQPLEIEYLGGSSGKTKIRDVELVCDERAESTGFGEGVGPPHTFLAGFGFSHMTQSSGSPKPPRCGF